MVLREPVGQTLMPIYWIAIYTTRIEEHDVSLVIDMVITIILKILVLHMAFFS